MTRLDPRDIYQLMAFGLEPPLRCEIEAYVAHGLVVLRHDGTPVLTAAGWEVVTRFVLVARTDQEVDA